MQPVLIWPDPAPPDVVRVLDLSGIDWETVTDDADTRKGVWSAAIVNCEEQPATAYAMAAQLRRGDLSVGPVLLLVRGSQLGDLEDRHDAFDDFCVVPAHPAELEARVRHLLASEGGFELPPEVITYESLELNLETYQASIDGRPLDLTYMEYELLKFLAGNPGRVFTREVLLSRVWGYEYYGGARTVDVHVRRLRAKLGEQHAALIQTVRSVGYKFGESRWGS
ncbi:MAG: response regulator transcription factor [Actinomycetia bacterium]|nr:response regulator transcription factor [Actinomycetes bacterium]